MYDEIMFKYNAHILEKHQAFEKYIEKLQCAITF